jgi:ribose transport system substrate-binding protein
MDLYRTAARSRRRILDRSGRVLGILAVVASLGAATACGSGSNSGSTSTANTGSAGQSGQTSGSTSSGLAQAEALVNGAVGEATWNGPTAGIDVSSLEGKTVYVISLDQAIPHINTITQVIKDVGKRTGVNVVVIDGKSQVSEWSRGIQQAIATKAAAIVAVAVDLDAVKSQLEQAKSQGIAVITGLSTDANAPIPDRFKSVIDGRVTEQYYRAGQVEAAWVLKDSGGHANVIAIDAPGLAVSVPVQDGIKNVFATMCPSCSVTWVHSPTSQWGSQLATNVRTALTRNPNATYIIPEFDGMATSVVSAIHQAGAASRVKVSTYNATQAILQLLKNDDVVGADSGTQGPWEAWALMDAAFRALLKQPAIENYHIPLRLFTKDNIGSIDLSKGEGAWYGPLDYAAKFQTLWGLS